MSWRESLIKLADFEVETLQKRLKDIADRRIAVELVLDALDLEAAAESARARADAQAGWYLVGFREALKQRRAKAEGDLRTLDLETEGARAALIQAFEQQKKFEILAENARVVEAKALARREGAALDELARRRTGT